MAVRIRISGCHQAYHRQMYKGMTLIWRTLSVILTFLLVYDVIQLKLNCFYESLGMVLQIIGEKYGIVAFSGDISYIHQSWTAGFPAWIRLAEDAGGI